MNTIEIVAREAILNLKAYSSARSLNKIGKLLLDANENPFACEQQYNRYPEPQPEQLKKLLSALYKVDEQTILITRGSDEGIDLLIRACCEAGRDALMITPPTYGMYEVAANIQGAQIVRVPMILKNDFQFDTEQMIQRWQPNIKILFLCSPNNPTGTLISRPEIQRICLEMQGKALVVVDEAYIEFADCPSMASDLMRFDNLVVLRTLSKAYGAAGLRVGCVLANESIIQLLKKVIAPYPIARPVVQAVENIVSADREEKIKEIQIEKNKLFHYLELLNNVETVYASAANFLLVKVNNAERWMSWCAENLIVLRSFSHLPMLENCVRITVGTQQENQFLQQVLSDV